MSVQRLILGADGDDGHVGRNPDSEFVESHQQMRQNLLVVDDQPRRSRLNLEHALERFGCRVLSEFDWQSYCLNASVPQRLQSAVAGPYGVACLPVERFLGLAEVCDRSMTEIGEVLGA